MNKNIKIIILAFLFVFVFIVFALVFDVGRGGDVELVTPDDVELVTPLVFE